VLPVVPSQVELVAVKWHNLPSLPNFVRAGNGLAFGTVPHLLEPLWSYLPEFIGDDFYRCVRMCVCHQHHVLLSREHQHQCMYVRVCVCVKHWCVLCCQEQCA
jgi:hypothetical protein